MKKCLALLVFLIMVLTLTTAESSLSSSFSVDRLDIVYKAKPEHPTKPSKTDNEAFKLLGAQWKTTPVSYTVNPTNTFGLNGDTFVNDLGKATEVWDAQTSTTELFNLPTKDITTVYGVLDGKNAVAFGNYPTDGVIAITSIWYNQRTKSILEFDMLFDTDFTWGDADINPNAMDVLNIATHEFGHSIGLADLYAASNSELTMYGYASEGETNKRTLENGDIAGLEKMYGP